jgi:hypothetical protein
MPAADGSMSAGEAVAKAESGEAVMSFLDGDSPADAADSILNEVLGGDGEAAPAGEAADAPKEGDAPAGDAAAEAAPAAPATPETPEAVKLRKGWSKLHAERQAVIERDQAAKRAIAEAEGFKVKANNFDAVIRRLQDDPAGLIEELEAQGLKGLGDKVLQSFIDKEKSPAEREVLKMRRELAERDAREQQAQKDRQAAADRDARERQVAEWRDGVKKQVEAAGEEYDLVNSLDLHGQVIDVMVGYYEQHSDRDADGNVTKPAVLDWKAAAKMVEDHHAVKLNGSKRYGKRAPVSQVSPPATAAKDASSAKATPAPAKRAPTLSAVPVAEAPSKGSELSLDPDIRYRQLMAEMGLS